MTFNGRGTAEASSVCQLVTKFDDSSGTLNLNDQPRSGRPVTATDNSKRQKVDGLIQENRRNPTARLTCRH